ncbi:hypothetical protein LWI29_007446 [Acer saccharum]|uniref:Uncharacterized protein n=1 Tax=Acer saccharum TaxID=4024 RepID=A0AA39SCK8_ACESA|nr:hypothetical protein LWI29_007446 [Acer saccharum]
MATKTLIVATARTTDVRTMRRPSVSRSEKVRPTRTTKVGRRGRRAASSTEDGERRSRSAVSIWATDGERRSVLGDGRRPGSRSTSLSLPFSLFFLSLLFFTFDRLVLLMVGSTLTINLLMGRPSETSLEVDVSVFVGGTIVGQTDDANIGQPSVITPRAVPKVAVPAV